MVKKIDYSIYLVAGSENAREGKLLSSIDEAIQGGCSMVQLREKDASSRDFYYTAVEVKKITDKYDIPLIINDRADIAVAVDAAGLHVGQSDLPAKIARKIIGENKILGISASNLDEALEAEKAGAGYLGVGAMFQTDTKTDAVIVTIEDLIAIRERIKLPIVVIGGINESNLDMFNYSGIDGIAVVSAILSKPDIKKATMELRGIFDGLK